jgi:hypothetical protein
MPKRIAPYEGALGFIQGGRPKAGAELAMTQVVTEG